MRSSRSRQPRKPPMHAQAPIRPDTAPKAQAPWRRRTRVAPVNLGTCPIRTAADAFGRNRQAKAHRPPSCRPTATRKINSTAWHGSARSATPTTAADRHTSGPAISRQLGPQRRPPLSDPWPPHSAGAVGATASGQPRAGRSVAPSGRGHRLPAIRPTRAGRSLASRATPADSGNASTWLTRLGTPTADAPDGTTPRAADPQSGYRSPPSGGSGPRLMMITALDSLACRRGLDLRIPGLPPRVDEFCDRL